MHPITNFRMPDETRIAFEEKIKEINKAFKNFVQKLVSLTGLEKIKDALLFDASKEVDLIPADGVKIMESYF